MSRFTAPILINRAPSATNDGSAPTNSSGLAIGDNTGAALASQEFWTYQVTATAGALPLYEAGYGGTSFVGQAINIPVLGTTAQVTATIPAGARIQYFSINIEQAPTVINAGVLTLSLNGTAVATYTVTANTLSSGFATWNATLTASQNQAMVGYSDGVVTASLAGTGIVGGLLAEISIVYTARRGNGTTVQFGQGLTNDGTGSNDVA